ncbi:phage tail protein [Avibacterium avium]|uniref:phage tail-collar fiber domain-containing protein n=1 Tax=Avibacterium avium TaxID=751 RepID=UPI003BF801E2
MAKQYYSVLTDYGTQMIASAIARKQPLQITQMAVGDGNGRATTPNSRNTGLVREVHRANISAISVDPRNNKQLIFELTIPENVGGFWIREMGIFDNQNRLVAYANCPDSFKPELTSGSGKVQVVRMILLVSSSDAVTLKVDDSVIFVTRGQLTPKKITATTKNAVDETGHSHEIDKASTKQAGIVQLTNDTNSDSETLGLTAKAGKTLKALIDALTRNLGNYIPNSKKSNAINSPSSDTVATSAAVKTAYDKGVEAKNRADSAYTLAQTKQSPATTLAGYGITDFVQRALTDSDNLNDITVKGIYNNSTYRNTPNNNYPEEISGVLIVLSNTEQVYFASNGKMFKRFKSNNNWANGWVRLDNLATPIGADQNLNEITTDGNYYIVGLSKATLAKNYPIERSDGALEVFGNGYFQRFTTFHSKQIFVRRKIAGNWMGWVQSMTQLGGTFTGNVSVPNLSATGTLQSNYRLVIDRNDPNYIPYINMLNRAVELNSDVPNKDFSCINFNASKNGADVTKVRIVAGIKQDKSTVLYLVTTNSRDQYSSNLTLFGGTGNVAVGKTTDNGTEKLQVAGTIGALGYINTTSSGWERLRATLADGSYWRWEVNPASATDPRFNFVYRFANGDNRYLAFPRLDKNETVAYQSWVNTLNAQKVSKSGDTMTGKLVIEDAANGSHSNAGIALINKGGGSGTAVHFDGHFHAGRVNKGGMHIRDVGSGAAEVGFLVTPNGDPNQDRRITGMTINKDGAIWAKQYGWLHDYFLRKEVIRKDYSRTIRGTNSWDNGTQRNINVVGNMTSYPDGRITQILHVKNFRMPWFAWEDYNIGYGGGGDRGFEIALDLWTAMPNKITQLSIVSSRASEGSLSAAFNNEAGEWVYGWNLRKQANNKNRIWVNAARTRGGSDELMDLYITVEGY